MSKVRVNGIEIHYQTMGTAADVVLIHGLSANLAFWHLRLAAPLSQHFRITTYDLRGHGYSDMPASGYTTGDLAGDLLGLLDHLGIERAHLVGHSFGGAVALQFSLLHPRRVKTLTLADARVPSLQPLPRLGERNYWNGWRNRIRKLGMEIPDDTPRVVYSLMEEIAREQNLKRDLGQLPRFSSFAVFGPNSRAGRQWRTLLERTSAFAELGEVNGLNKQNISQMTLPTMAIYGEYSHCMPTCRGLIKLLPHCNKVIVPAVGHFHPAVRPLVFINHLVRFIKCHE